MEFVRDTGAVGVLVLFGLFVLTSLLLLPGAVITLGAGAIYGWEIGAVLATVSSTTVAALNFYTSRYLLHAWMERRMESRPRTHALFHAIAKKGWPLILFSRFSPIFPHSLVSYASGLTRISTRTFLLASLVGFFPLSLAYAYAGHVLGQVALRHADEALWCDPLTITIWVASVVVTVLVAIVFAIVVAKVFRSVPDDDDESDTVEPSTELSTQRSEELD